MTGHCIQTPRHGSRRGEVWELYTAAMRGERCRVHGLQAEPVELPTKRWMGQADASDLALLARCAGPVLDVGCGPGRMTYGLSVQGVPALGIDVVPEAVELTRARGAAALLRNAFKPVPAEGRWATVLLADGNIGIGGDPARLLRRTRRMIAPYGRIVVDLATPGTGLRSEVIELEVGGRRSHPFVWTSVGPEALHAIAEAVALRVLRVAEHQGRWFAEVGHAGSTR